MTVTQINARTGETTTREFTAEEQAEIAARIAAEAAKEAAKNAREEDLDELPLTVKALGFALVRLGVVSAADLRREFKAAIKQLR